MKLEIIETQRPSPRQESTIIRKGFPRSGYDSKFSERYRDFSQNQRPYGYNLLPHTGQDPRKNNIVMIGSPFGGNPPPVGVITKENFVGLFQTSQLFIL